jgi:hypothetical protein
MSAKNVVLTVNDWSPHEVKYMPPKVNDRGGKSINIISKQTNRTVHISTPLLTTWGISDYLDEKTQEGDGKFSISLQFPNEDNRNDATDAFLAKLQIFEKQILNDAVKNSELWFGEEKSLEICKDRFFPFIKYSKDKDTKKTDYSKPPTFRPKVPCYDGKWGLEIYDVHTNLIFPCESETSGLPMTPMELVPKLSRVACGLQCGGIWIGGKGWGVTWKMFQCIVKPLEIIKVSGTGKCQFQLSGDDLTDIPAESSIEVEPVKSTSSRSVSTEVEDSDNEDATEDAIEVVVEEKSVAEEVVADEVVAEEVVADEVVAEEVVADEVVADEVVAEEVVVKKVLKKVVVAPVVVAPVVVAPVVVAPVVVAPVVEEVAELPKKKMIIKKKAV